jgi:translation initiation factor IF-1
MKKRKQQDKERVEREDSVKLEGVVVDALPAGEFNINIGESVVIAKLSGRMRQNKIRVLIADRVEVEFSPYDLTRGRLVRRL